jgi:cyclopropane-fatty-acyl-phospholipid synthase
MDSSSIARLPASLESDRRLQRWMGRWARRLVLGQLRRLRHGEMRVLEGGREHRFGRDAAASDLSTTVRIHDPAFFRQLVLGGSVAAGETYCDGHWSCDDLTALFRIVLKNPKSFAALDGWQSWGMAILRRLRFRADANTRVGSRRNIAAHYDLGNEFFRLFLDETLMYSSGVFESDSTPLAFASHAKNEMICRKLQLSPADHLLEIGSGWGGFAIHAAGEFGCRVTTATISRNQFDATAARIRTAGLEDRVTVLLKDYRDLTGTFDKLVSIEMIEAVGEAYLPMFVRSCGKLLRPGGSMLLQCILIADQHDAAYRRTVDFIQRHIFPGGFLPSLKMLRRLMNADGQLRLRHVDDLTAHYPPTLRHWCGRFLEQSAAIRAIGFSDEQIRMWEYYFRYCEAGFLERMTRLVHLVADRDR